MEKSWASKWKVQSKPVILQNNEVHIWLVDIKNNVHDLEFYCKLLFAEELDQANRFHFEKDRIRHVITHGILRLLISRYLGIKPDEILFTYNKRRKPEIVNKSNKKLCFNLSHSGNYILFAFSWDRKLGIDIELEKQIKDADGIIERFCSEHEKKEYFSFPPESRSKIFFNCWTRKEAYIKARGDGLYFPLENFSVSIDPLKPPLLLEVKDEPHEKEHWYFHDIIADKDYSSCLAIESKEIEILYFNWEKQFNKI